MIALALDSCLQAGTSRTSDPFEKLIPSIERIASFVFRRVPRWRRAELVADVVAAAFCTFKRLIERGLEHLVYPSPLAWIGIRRVRADLQVGCRQNSRDVLSPQAQRRRGFDVEQLQQGASQDDWRELADSCRATPADVAAFRLDVGEWLRRLSPRKRHVALRLAAGDSTQEAARHAGLSNARISQLRRELLQNWNAFQFVPA